MLRPGRDIAIKAPLHNYEETVAFYRDRGGLFVIRTLANSTGFDFGETALLIDRVSQQSRQDVWLELFSDAPTEAPAKLGGPQRDELEPLDGVTGHWTSDPAGTVPLVRKDEREPETERED